jgi:peptidoglycan/LPS O-acetylase OafA/YrhL
MSQDSPRQKFSLREVLTASPSIAEVAKGRDNNFNLVRFLAASLVILHHAKPNIQVFATLTGGRESAGSLAVLFFFVISGFLITQSFAGSSLKAFIAARVLRIFPALWVAVPFSIVVASFASAMPWGRFLTHPQTLKFWLHDSFLWDLQYNLPGAFLHVPIARDVNGSLWTLPTEMRMYMVCALLGLAGLYSARSVFNAFLLVVMLIGATVKVDTLPFVGIVNVAQWELAFLLGGACYINRHEIRLNIPVALLLLGTTAFIEDPEMGRLYIVPALVYATLCVSLHPALFFRPFTRLGDYSYGLYIYAFPIQQIMVFYYPHMNWLKRMALTFPIVLGVAFLSWHLIEQPALRLKRHFRPQPPPERVPSPEFAHVSAGA